MHFLNWPTGLAAAALVIPPLVALYFLKLKRRSVPIPSTLLWKRAVQDLQVNSPFQRLRNNLLLWLQLLILLLAVVALARPVLMAEKKRSKSLILLLDRSSSMNVREADGMTRFEKAKQQAGLAIDDMGDDDQAMIIGFDDRARMASAFTSDRNSLKKLIDELESSEGLSRLGEALQLAEAYSQPQIIAGPAVGSDVTPVSAEPEAHMILFSDGRIDDAEQLVVRRASMELVKIGQTDDNAGIVGLDVRRNYEQPEMLNVFARAQNFSRQPLRSDVSLVIQGQVVEVKEVALEPGGAAGTPTTVAVGGSGSSTSAHRLTGPPPGSVALVTFDSVLLEAGGSIELRLERKDAFAADNVAWTIVPPPRHIRVLLVTRGNYFLTKVLRSLAVEHIILTPEAYESAPVEKIQDGERSAYDVVIFDDHSTQKLPPGNYFFLGGVPKIEGVSSGEVVDDEVLIDWDDTHPVLRNVNMEGVHVFQWNRLTLPANAQKLIEGQTGPVMGYFSRDARQYLIMAFSLLDKDRKTFLTSWVLKWHFVAMVSDALQYLSSGMSAGTGGMLRPGETFNITATGQSQSVTVIRPDQQKETVPIRFANIAPYAETRRFGLYRAAPAEAGSDLFAVNLLDANESNIGPNPQLVIGAEAVRTSEDVVRTDRPLWPWLLAAALVILMLEWIVYNRRVFV